MHCAVPFFCARSRMEGEAACRCAGGAEVLGKGVRKCSGREKIFGGECVVGAAGVRRGCVGERKCAGRGCENARAVRVAVRGREQVFGGEWVVRSAGVRLGCGDVAGGQGQGVSPCEGGSRLSARNAWRSLRACVWATWGSGSARAGREKVLGKGEDLRRRMGCEVGGRASGLRGRAEVLGQGASLCGDGRRSSVGNGW